MQWMLGSLKFYVYTCIIMFYFYNLFPINKIFVFNTHPNISSNKLINGRKLTDLWCVLYVFLFYFNHRCSSEVLWIYIYISMKQPLMIDRDTRFLEMCPNFSFWKWSLKVQILATCVHMSVRYINNFWRVVGLTKFLIKSRVIFFVPIQAKGLRQTRFLDLLPRSFRGKSYIFKKKILI